MATSQRLAAATSQAQQQEVRSPNPHPPPFFSPYISNQTPTVPTTFQKVIHWYNPTAQYWVYPDSAGKFTSPPMLPGTYTMVLYQTELKAATTTVTVKAGATTSKSLASALTAHTTIWQIGAWDGQPTGFRNAANQLRMHPSDKRMAAWTATPVYTVGSSALSDLPMALFKGVNSPLTIKWTGSTTAGATLRVGTTLAFGSGRPQISVNGGAFKGPAPAAPVKIDSRGVTRGAYRGFGEVYDVVIPAGILKAGANTLTVDVISGNAVAGFLSPSIVSISFFCLSFLEGVGFGLGLEWLADFFCARLLMR